VRALVHHDELAGARVHVRLLRVARAGLARVARRGHGADGPADRADAGRLPDRFVRAAHQAARAPHALPAHLAQPGARLCHLRLLRRALRPLLPPGLPGRPAAQGRRVPAGQRPLFTRKDRLEKFEEKSIQATL